MGTTQFQYSDRIIRRKLWINTGIAMTGVVYAAVYGLSHSLFDFFVLAMIGLALHRVYRSFVILTTRMPAIVISDDGLRDAHLGDILIPWTAISEVRTVAPDGLAVGLLLMVDATQLRQIPGPITGRIINFIAGARPGRSNRRMALLMTPAAALDTTLTELIDNIRAHSPTMRFPTRR
jgi:hypothetical protein